MIIFGAIQLGVPHGRTDRHKIGGTAKVNGVPAARYVSAYDRRNSQWLATTISDPVTGAWAIYGLPELPLKSLLVIEMDTTEDFNAATADYVSQKSTA